MTTKYLSTDKDVLLTKEKAFERECDRAGGFDQFMDGLRNLGDLTVDFVKEVLRECDRRKYNADLRAKALRSMGRGS
jgi:hypothetical protein